MHASHGGRTDDEPTPLPPERSNAGTRRAGAAPRSRGAADRVLIFHLPKGGGEKADDFKWTMHTFDRSDEPFLVLCIVKAAVDLSVGYDEYAMVTSSGPTFRGRPSWVYAGVLEVLQ